MSGSNGGFGINRPRFSPEDLDSIFSAWERGESARSIAARFGCHPSAVQYHLRRTLRVVPRRDQDSLVGTVARCARCGIDTPRRGLCQDCCDVEGVTA